MESIFSWVTANSGNISAIIIGAIALAKAIVALTPSKGDDAIVGKVEIVVNKVAGFLTHAPSPTSTPKKD